MAKMQKVEEVVRKVMRLRPETRDDDFLLLLYTYYEIDRTTSSTSFRYLMENHVRFGLPSFESVSRARRKLQSEDTTLRSGRQTRKRRTEEEEKFREYAHRAKGFPF